ncbi:ABC transporter ATP-binding protein/permease [Salinarimonas ramus]|uniref:ATP-binding protein n=1 Tax=Salinarimonas ramus TaxID=690164 RepID=A0A917Q4C7_9HYPH|nr:ABC transporter ATP-binding protein/permease [Salinarimonas ramus]GGK21371.1 ATP-binding protein [Salinarimonas ramus]
MVKTSALFAVAGALLMGLALMTEIPVSPLVPLATLTLAVVLYLARDVSTFIRILIALIAGAHVLLTTLYVAAAFGAMPEFMAEFVPPVSMPAAAGVFAAVVAAVGRLPVIRQITILTDPYFTSREVGTVRIWPFPTVRAQERYIGTGILAIVVTMQFALVAISVRLSYWNRDWFNAIQERNEAEFWRLLLTVWVMWVVIAVTMAIYQYAIRMTLDMRWRAWLTEHYTSRWLSEATQYRMQVFGNQTDNPDQRIQEDVRKFTSLTLSLTLGILAQVSTLVSFSVILWTISADFTFPGTSVEVPGLLFWIALVYAVVATWVTHLIGRPLISLNFLQEKYEADFRFSLARMREYAEQVSLLRGERAERASLGRQFRLVMDNFFRQVGVSKRLIAFTSFYDYSNSVVPYVIAAPFYFAGTIQLGVMTQTAGAFARVEGALSFFINAYQTLAEYKAVVDRLTSFEGSIDRARNAAKKTGEVALLDHDGEDLRLDGVVVRLPDGTAIVRAEGLSFAPGTSVLLAGPSGTGKSTLFRAISGIWPFGEGAVKRPRGASIMLLPQRPYLPGGTLRGAVAYPEGEDVYEDATIIAALEAVRLGHLAPLLSEDRIWAQTLSLGEQQRLAAARALLARPDWLLMDEATAAMDEATEEAIYGVLKRELDRTTIVSIGHRSTLNAFHERRVDMVMGEGGLYEPADVREKVAAE